MYAFPRTLLNTRVNPCSLNFVLSKGFECVYPSPASVRASGRTITLFVLFDYLVIYECVIYLFRLWIHLYYVIRLG